MMHEIVNASIGDLAPLAGMFDRYRQFYRQLSDLSGAEKFLRERINKEESVIYVSRQGTDYTGFVQCYPVFSSVAMKRLWLLNDLFIKENFRGQGISKLLIDRCKRLAVETAAAGLMLETAKTNAVGNWLYPQEGFVLNKSSNFYFWPNPS